MAINNVTTNTKPEKGITYSVITDSSSDWPSVGNDVYFYDKATSLPYYKNSSGTVVSLFEEGGGTDTFVTGGTYSGSTIILNRNDGNTVNVTGITSDSIYTSNGTVGTGRVATLTDTLSFNSGTLVLFNQNVDINANWRANKGVLNINTNNQSFAGLGLTDTTNGYYGGFFWRPTTNYLTIGSNSAGIALEPTANNQAYVFKSNQFEFTKGGFISGKLELSTTTDGFLMPRLTTAQKNAISSPDTNLMVFDTDLSSLQRYNGSAWVDVAVSSNIYTADGTVSDAERVVTLTGNKRITYLGGRVKIDVVASSGTFEFNKNSTKFLEINGNIDLFRSNFKRFENSANQNFFLDIANTTTVCDAQWYSTGTARTHTIRTGSSQRAHFNENGSGTFIVGNNSVVSGEDISLQGDTIISKKLELSTTTDGFLMPRLTTSQKNAISSPDTNLMVFDTNLSSLQRYNGSAWVDVSDDTFVTGGTYSGSTIILNRNDGNSVDVTGITSSNIYTADGTLTGNRTVDLNGKTLSITQTGNFDGLKIDYTSSGLSNYQKNSFQILSEADGGNFAITGKQGGVLIEGNNSFTKKDQSGNIDFQIASGGGGYWKGSTITIGEDSFGKIVFPSSSGGFLYFYNGSDVSHLISRGANNQFVAFFRQGLGTNKTFVIGGTAGIGTERISLQGDTLISKKLELSTTTDGFLMPRLTTAQKNAISSPDTNLMVFDKDLNSLQRYNGSAWVAMAAGYGLIEVVRDSDSGSPIFYSDLQTALETCKTSGSSNIINIHSDITLTSQININKGGTGSGNGYLFDSLTINFNGFEVIFDDTGSTNAFELDLSSNPADNQKVIFLNGKISRLNGTGTHRALNVQATQYISLYMSQMIIYCQNSQSAYIANAPGTGVNSPNNDFGGSTFISSASSGSVCGFMNGDNFKIISLGNANGFASGTAQCRNAYVECQGSGIGLTGGVVYNSYIKTNTGACSSGSVKIYSSTLVSTSGKIIDSGGGAAELHNSYAETGNSVALNFIGLVSNSTVINNSASDLIQFPANHRNSTLINKGSGKVADINFNTRKFDNCFILSVGGVAITTGGACNGVINNCTIKSEYNSSGGHAITLNHSSNTLFVSNTVLEVVNSSANCLNASSAKNISISNSNFKGATTPINANITLDSLEIDAFGNVTT